MGKSSAPRRAPASGPPLPPNLGGRFAARLAWMVASSVSATLRWTYEDRSGLFSPDCPQHAIFAVWHNRQLLAPGLYRRYFRPAGPKRRLAALASASRDGAIAARILELFGARAVRGSSSRRGATALSEMIALAAEGYDIAVTPDGPRGPRYRVQPGAIALAQHTGLPLVPIAINVSRKKVLPSWDGFQIPLPFGACSVVTTEAMQVPRELDDAGLREHCAELERRLLTITRD
ncbi:MAG: lysophospholipid acyltransferase family protein [Verrucomicrobia bacterium]|nr:lysophospholipid acyltransferase family protein [Verrucomicrobiota bacterium]